MSTHGRHPHRYPLKPLLILVGCAFLLSCSLMIATTPIHELAHVIMSGIDPHLTVVAFYPFGVPESHQSGHFLSSYLGCVIVQEAYPGAFQDRPIWADLLQEIICLLIQVSISCYLTYKIMGALLNAPCQHHRRPANVFTKC